jgi:hypothetical protein
MRRPAGKYGKPGWYVSIWCLARCRSMSGGYRGLLVHVHGPPRVILFRQEPLKVSPSLIGPPASRSQFRLSYRSPKDKLGYPSYHRQPLMISRTGVYSSGILPCLSADGICAICLLRPCSLQIEGPLMTVMSATKG